MNDYNENFDGYYDEKLEIFFTVFDDAYINVSFREKCAKHLVALESLRFEKYLVDQTNMESISLDNQKWVEEYWYPKAIALGLTKMAFVLPKDLIGKLSLEMATEKHDSEKSSLQNAYFDNKEDAINWLIN